jgi:Ca2+-binding EF-hand superfamily protein
MTTATSSSDRHAKFQVEKEYATSPGSRNPEQRNPVIAKRLAEALIKWLQTNDPQGSLDAKNPACKVHSGWTVIWELVDKKQQGYLAMKDFNYLCGPDVLNVTRELQPHYAMDHLHVFWQAIVDAAAGPYQKVTTDMVTAENFAFGLYRIHLRSWPRIPPSTLRQLVRKIGKRAEKTHGFNGNWGPILAKYDDDDTDTITFNKFHAMIRKPFPGLGFSKDEVTDMDIRSIWRESDEEEDGVQSTSDFGAFLRISAAIPDVSESDGRLNKEQVRSIILRLLDGLRKWQKTRGVSAEPGASSFADMNLQWCVLFHLADENSNRSLDVQEFKYAVKHVAKMKDISDMELEGIFRILDLDGSGGLTYEEFALAFYRQEVIWWPCLAEEEIRKAVDVLTKSAIIWLYTYNNKKMGTLSMNWIKVLEAQNVDGAPDNYASEHQQFLQGKFQFNEFVGFIRGKAPGLNISKYNLTDDQARGLWKAIDADRMSKVPTAQIAAFLRTWAKDRPVSPVASASSTKARTRLPDRKPSLRTLQARRQGWNIHSVPSASGVLHHDDALRCDFQSTGNGKAHSTKSKYGYGGIRELV